MSRHLLWVAAALALSLPLLAHQNRAVAQQTGTSAETETDPKDASADADAEINDQADAEAESSDTSTLQADSETSASDESAQAEAATNDEAAEEKPAPSSEAQGNPGANNHQSTQDEKSALPPPSKQSDPNATQSREVEGQEPNRQDSTIKRHHADASDQGRANPGGRSGRDRENELRVGIQFGRATDRGLTINHIEQNSFYHHSGFRRGDIIVSVQGRPIRSDADFMRFIIMQPGQPVPVVVMRDGRRETIYVEYRDVADNNRGYGNRQRQAGGAYLGVAFDPQMRDAAVVLSVNPGSPAQEAGLQAGDILVVLNGQEIQSYPDAIAIIRGMRPGDELEIVVERARTERQVVALLDTPPNVRTAGRPDVQVERRTIIQQPAQVEVDLSDDYDDNRLIDRNRDSDYNRGRGLLPRRRN